MLSPQLIILAKATSRLVGWIYTIAWSLSFYPQPLLNLRRRSTVGTTLSFPIVNVLGFVAYFISTIALFWSPLIRAQYAARNPVSPEPTVRGNDVIFAGHSVLMSMTVCSMFFRKIWGFDQDGGRHGKWRVGKLIMGVFTFCILGVSSTVMLVLIKGGNGGRDPVRWAWLDVIYALGYVKLVVTMVKYMPQVVENYRRQSTTGWSIEQIILDVVGGVFSTMQLLIDGSLQDDWSGITGNPVKLGLGNISLFFDLIFLTQHYLLYPGPRNDHEKALTEERRELLVRDVETASHNS